MRKYIIMAALLLAAMALCPLAAMGSQKSEEAVAEVMPVISYSVESEIEYITVMSSETGSMQKIKMREYLIGCVAAEMPPNYHEEALKAQAVASYTYAKRITENSSDFISDSPLTHQGYVSRQDRMKNWGDDFEENERIISDAVDAVYGYEMTYNGETALAVYHSISAGQTQSAEKLWGTDYLYLRSVPSPGDKLSPDFSYTVSFSPEEFAEKLGIDGDADSSEWIEEIQSENGYVDTVVVCGKEFSGVQIRDALELRSSSFEISHQNEKITVTCKGHGHGVGMSQYGADYMARQGSTWQEILNHYYAGTVITETDL